MGEKGEKGEKRECFNGLEFKSKAEMLRWMGKYEKDVRLVERMIRRGEVVYDGGVYRIVPRNDVKALIKLIESYWETEEEREKVMDVIKKILYNNKG